jgi:TDG/mug DNA glycosylase family protein
MRPRRAELEAAAGTTVPDVIAPGLRVLFCGINPGLYTAVVGHHFGRPGNRFWPALHRSGFTPRQFAPAEQTALLALGLGITNLVERASARADALTTAELRAGAERLRAKVAAFRPHWLAVLGIGAYRAAFAAPRAILGRQPEALAWAEGGGATHIWLLPNPSGLNAHFPLAALAAQLAELRRAADLAQPLQPSG